MSKKKKTDTYYAISGLNAYGVYTNLEKAQNAAKYVIDFHGGKFSNFENAEVWAVNTFFSLQDPYNWPKLYRVTRLNWLYYREKCRRRFIYDD